jgi:hypothetical protein
VAHAGHTSRSAALAADAAVDPGGAQGRRRIAYLLLSLGVCSLTGFSARRFGRDDNWWWVCAYFFPFVTPIVLALLPDNPNSPHAEMRRAARESRGAPAKAATGTFEDRFPLLVECMSGQAAETQAGLRERFLKVKSNLEFTVASAPGTASRLIEEAPQRGFALSTGALGPLVWVYGAGLVPQRDVDEVANWLTAACAPGQKVKVAFRDPEGMLHLVEHHPEHAAGAGA